MNDIKTDILYKLNALIATLGTVRVSGEADCGAILGSIKILRDLCVEVNSCDIEDHEKKPVNSAKEV